ncbi:mechanosensitive ion channel domain-containing protein [Sphingomonas sp. 1P06PA]|uniref:mechanosensitive ion channel family protein n=1 Tax=Sphingomonas sp. 1P06PA TaxID=554121 RepID=UPI0039A505B1
MDRAGSSTGLTLVRALDHPARWLLVALALSAIQPALALDADGRQVWRQVSGLLMPALLGWLAIGGLGAINQIVQARADISVADNLRARRRRTRASILHRIALIAVGLISFCLMLMSIPSIRSIGVTLIASAGLAALAVGAAAQPALKNLIAGLQMAFTEPIRLDDVVVIEGEWGRIEDIRLTYVVVKLWDERRLVVPVSRFLDSSFQNWTRQTSELIGSVHWQLNPSTDIGRLREWLGGYVRTCALWDGRFYNLQVTDMKSNLIEVRALVTAKDASAAFDLRCEVREAMLEFIARDMPLALPRSRAEIELASS